MSEDTEAKGIDQPTRRSKFQIAERRYRLYKGKDKKRGKTDFSNVIDLAGEYSGDRAKLVNTDPASSHEDSDCCKIWKIPEVEGLFVLTNALDKKEQVFWAKKAVSEFSKCAHTNLTNLYGPQPDHWADSVKCKNIGKDSGFYKLRWASLGFHYDWTKRLYHKNEKSDFPDELAQKANSLAKKVGLCIDSEAAIVNFYPFDGSMGGHIDDAELTLDYPIVSMSIGCAAVFLIGGKTKDKDPTAIFVRSGDVVIMGGHSRLCYHGVPRIVKGTCTELVDWIKDTSVGSEDNQLLAQYLEASRINMNIRQVVDSKNNFESSQKSAYPRANK